MGVPPFMEPPPHMDSHSTHMDSHSTHSSHGIFGEAHPAWVLREKGSHVQNLAFDHDLGGCGKSIGTIQRFWPSQRLNDADVRPPFFHLFSVSQDFWDDWDEIPG